MKKNTEINIKLALIMWLFSGIISFFSDIASAFFLMGGGTSLFLLGWFQHFSKKQK